MSKVADTNIDRGARRTYDYVACAFIVCFAHIVSDYTQSKVEALEQVLDHGLGV